MLSLFAQNAINADYIFFDLETTGLNPLMGDRVIEAAFIKVSGGSVKDTFETFINPLMLIPEDASRINNIYNEDVADAPEFDADMINKIRDFIGDGVLVAHNSAFDLGFLSSEFARNGVCFSDWHSIDTLKMAKSLFPKDRHRLKNLMTKYGIKEDGELHRALYDTQMLKEVFFEMLAEEDMRGLTSADLVKKYGFSGETEIMNHYIPLQMRKVISAAEPFKCLYKTQENTEVKLHLLPLAPVWIGKKWFLLCTDMKNKKSVTIYCKRVIDIL